LHHKFTPGANAISKQMEKGSFELLQHGKMYNTLRGRFTNSGRP